MPQCTNFTHMQVQSLTASANRYWTLAQMVAHHTVGGCNLGCGDLLGTGTISRMVRVVHDC